MNFHTNSYQLELTQAKDTSKDDSKIGGRCESVFFFLAAIYFILIEQVNWILYFYIFKCHNGVWEVNSQVEKQNIS